MIHHYLRILFWDVYDYFSKTWYKAHYRANYVDSRTPEERMREPKSVTTSTTGGEPIVVSPRTSENKCVCGRTIYVNETHCGACDFNGEHPQSEWEAEFDRKFDNYAYVAELYTEAQMGDLNLHSLKSFIRSLLHSRDEKLRALLEDVKNNFAKTHNQHAECPKCVCNRVINEILKALN